MPIELRPVRPEEFDQLGQLTSYAYGGNYGDGAENTVTATTRPEWTMCAFDGPRLVASYSTIPFTMRANGTAVPMGGVSAVGTLPEYRRQGLVRRIVTRAFADMRERGQAVASLWASQAAIYQRYGYAMASVLRSYRVDTPDIGFHDGDAGSSSVERLDVASGYDLVKGVYIAFIAERMCYLHRARPLWLNNAFDEDDAPGPIHVALSRDAGGEPDGYAIYTLRANRHDHASRGQELVIRDLAWLTPDAYRSLWSFIARHDLVGSVRWDTAPSDDPAVEFFMEPRMLHTRDHEGFWLRVVDAPAALAGRGWDADGEISLGISEDTLAPWNAGNWRVTVSGGSAEVAPGGGNPDLALSVKALALLYTGRRSARELAAWGMLEGEPSALRRADALFATPHAPHCPDHF